MGIIESQYAGPGLQAGEGNAVHLPHNGAMLS
jgi:hypothetical protein